MSDNSLVLLDEARTRLAKVASAKEAKTIRDQAAAVEHWSRQQKGALESANYASEIKVRAERRIGELLKAVPRETPKRVAAKGGIAKASKSATSQRGDKQNAAEVVTPPTPLAAAIAEAEITPRMAEDCQKLAAIPEPLFEAAVVTMREDPEIKHRGVSTAGMLRVHRESDGSIESITKAVKKEAADDPKVRYFGAVSRLLKDANALIEVLEERPFAAWTAATRKSSAADVRACIDALRRIEKEMLP